MELKNTKAVVGACVAGIAAFLAPIGTALHSNQPITGTVWFDAGVAALGVAALVFPSVFYTTNAPKDDGDI